MFDREKVAELVKFLQDRRPAEKLQKDAERLGKDIGFDNMNPSYGPSSPNFYPTDENDPAAQVGRVGQGSNAATAPKPSFSGRQATAEQVAAKLSPQRRHPNSGRFVAAPPPASAVGQKKFASDTTADHLSLGIFGIVAKPGTPGSSSSSSPTVYQRLA